LLPGSLEQTNTLRLERSVQSAQGIRTGGEKGERRSVTSQAPPLLRQRKPYLTGSPPSRQERRCRQECRMSEYNAGLGRCQNKGWQLLPIPHSCLPIEFHSPDKSGYWTTPFPLPHLSGSRVNQALERAAKGKPKGCSGTPGERSGIELGR
jgi:hypothetical protein